MTNYQPPKAMLRVDFLFSCGHAGFFMTNGTLPQESLNGVVEEQQKKRCPACIRADKGDGAPCSECLETATP